MSGPDLSGRSILITGGASGIGRATALHCAQAGAAITVTDIDEGRGAAVAREIVDAGGLAQFVRLDVSSESETEAAVAEAVRAFGKLDGACNAAGVQMQGVPLHEISSTYWDKVQAINMTALFYSMRAQVKAMLEAGGGAIVNIASTAGIAGIPNAADYCASKGGVVAITRGAALDYARKGIRVNAVLPGATLTPMLEATLGGQAGLEEAILGNSPMGRFGQAEEIAFAIRWLLSGEASFVTGHIMPVDGGLTAA